ncbi:MAG: tRNA (adenosine(37)-N6)-threonylcarbamoyltransferase complex dimerization subunit type 1 TsaB [bacterium]
MNKPILAIGTAGKVCSVALLINETDFFVYNINKNQVHSEKLINMVDTVLKDAKTELNELEAIAVSIGPGSFTGLRIGLSAAKGMALGNNLPIIPVSEFDAAAFQVLPYIKEGDRFNIAIKVNRDEIYFAKYQKEQNNFVEISNIKIINMFELKDNLFQNELLFGNVDYPDIVNINGVSAENIAKWASLFGKDLLTLNYDYLEPNYIKNFTAR